MMYNIPALDLFVFGVFVALSIYCSWGSADASYKSSQGDDDTFAERGYDCDATGLDNDDSDR